MRTPGCCDLRRDKRSRLMTPEIVPLSHDHLVEWYGEAGRGPTVKGITAFLDGQMIAVAGFRISGGHVVAFCDLKDEARPFKAAIHRTAVRLLAEAGKRHRRILAICDDNEATAPKWLSRLGFRPTDEPEVWEWRTSV